MTAENSQTETLIQEEEPQATILASFALEWNIVKAIRVFASEDTTRYTLNGVLFQMDKNHVTLAGTDGRRLGAIRVQMDFLAFTEPFEAIMPNELIQKVRLGKSLLPSKIAIKRFKGKVIFRVSDALEMMAFEGPAIDGNFPNWKQVVPNGNFTKDVHVHVNPDFIADYASVRKLFKSDKGMRILAKEGDEKGKSPFVVDIGVTDFISVLMPMRDSEEERYSYSPRAWALPKAI